MKALNITTVTLVGVDTSKYPVDHGNCFSVEAEDGKEYRIVNFYYENIKEAINREKIQFPIEIKLICKNTAIIDDERIPDSWYANRYCEVCCPYEHIPVNQKQRKDRAIRRGEVVIREFDSEIGPMKLETWYMNKHPDFRTKEEIKAIEEARKDWKIVWEDDINLDSELL